MDTKNSNDKPGAESPLPPLTGSAFQVVDHSDDETYYPLGMFPTLEAAIAKVETYDEEPWRVCEHADDYARIEIRDHAFGMSGHGNLVWSREWVRKYENSDDSEWVVFIPAND